VNEQGELKVLTPFGTVNEQGEPKVLTPFGTVNEQGEPKVLPVTSFLRFEAPCLICN
jgi:hypothetical protein